MAREKVTRYVYNVKNKVAYGATKTILGYLHKKNMKDLRLMPEGWKPGDNIDLDTSVDPAIPQNVLTAIVSSIAAKLPDTDEQTIRLAVSEATGQQVVAPEGDIPAIFDPNALQEVVAAISDLDSGNKDHYTNGGKPDAKMLSKVLDRFVSADERDQGFELFAASVAN